MESLFRRCLMISQSFMLCAVSDQSVSVLVCQPCQFTVSSTKGGYGNELDVLGKDHPDTLSTMNSLSFTWRGYGQYAEAIEMMEKCVSLQGTWSGGSR